MSAARVVAVCGPPGSGKSSLSRALAARLGRAPVIAYDSYERITEWPPDAVETAPQPGEILGEPVPDRLGGGLLRLCGETGGRPMIVFDTLLGRAHPGTAPLIDHLIWLDLPPDVALARKLRALIGSMWGSDGLAGLDGYLSRYESLLSPTYAVQRERVRPGADQILDARAPVEALVDAVAAAITASFR